MCASAVREGLKNPEPESVLQQMCLGGREFLDELMAKSGQRPVRQRAGFEEIRTAIERVREERWDTLVSRHGDWSRELALYWIRENGHARGWRQGRWEFDDHRRLAWPCNVLQGNW